MFQRRTPQLLGVALLCTALALTGQSSFAEGDPPRLDDASARSVIELGNGDRVLLTTPDETRRTIVEPLPRTDGTTPGLILSSNGAATTVQATDHDGAPAVVNGTAHLETVQENDDLVELRFEAIGRDGRPAIAHVNVFDVETGAISTYRSLPGDPDAECSASPSQAPCILLPRGTYSLMALVTTMPADQSSTARDHTIQNLSLVGDPEVTVFRDRIFTFDARKAEKVSVHTPGSRTKVNDRGVMELGYRRTAANGEFIRVAQRPSWMLDKFFYQQPTDQVRLGGLQTLTRLRLEAPDIELSAPRAGALHPEYYNRVWFSDVSSQFPVYDGRDRLRVVDVGHATAEDLAGEDLRGAVAVAERSDDISVADQSNGAAEAGAELVVVHNDGPGDNDDPGDTGTLLEVPTLRLNRVEARELLDLRPHDRVLVRGESVTPYVYDMVLKEDDRIPEDLTYTVRDGKRGNLSVQVRELHGQPTKGSTFAEAAYPWQPGDTFVISTMFPLRGGAQARTEYRLADPATRWSFATATPETKYNALFPRVPVLEMVLTDPAEEAYRAGERRTQPVANAPITAGPNPAVPFERSGDRMRVYVSGFLDADGNHGAPYTDPSGMRTHLQIRADDEVVADTTALPQGIAQLPEGDSRVSIAFTAENPQPWTELSTHTDTTWVFDSAAVPEGEVTVQPAIIADFDVDVDLRNRARGRAFDLNLAHLDGDDPSSISSVELQASYDDGESWRDATVTQRGDGRHRVVLPRGHGFVSLKLSASDDTGSELDQRIIRAWYVR